MSTYTKLFSSIIHSTIWQAPDHVRLVWITMLAMKDQHGVVEASVPGLAKAAGKSVGETQAALAMLRAPDEFSRTKDHEGRRIEDVDGGWVVLNHERYRDELGPDEAKAKAAARKKRWRDSKRDISGQSRDMSQSVPNGPAVSTVEVHQYQHHEHQQDQDPESRAAPDPDRARPKFAPPPDLEEPIAVPAGFAPDRARNLATIAELEQALAPSHAVAPSRRPELIAARLYKAGYEAARPKIVWMSHNKHARDLDAIGAWAEAQGRAEGKPTETVLGELFANAFAADWLARRDFSISLIAGSLGEIYSPPPRAPDASSVRVPNTRLLEDLRQQIGQWNSSGRKDTAQKVEALDALISAEYANPTGIPDEPVSRRGTGHR